MPTDRPHPAVRYARRLLARADPAAPSDAELLGRFADGRDEDAFAALLDRHGPMVLGVCRRVAADPDDADDAFQATFLVLARRAKSVRRRDAVAGWLYAVAVRVAQDARDRAARRRARERRADPPPPTPPPDPTGAELRAALDEEVRRLPEKYRAPVVLHHLEGLTKADAARRLGWAEGTVSGRLDRARALLRARLTRRGVAPPAAGLIAVTSAAPSQALRDATLQAGLAFAAGRVAAPTAATALADGVLAAGLATRLKVACAVALLASGVAAGTALGSRDGHPESDAVQPLPAVVRVSKPPPLVIQAVDPDPPEEPDEFDRPGPRDRAVDRLVGISLGEWEASWKQDLNVVERPAGEVLRGLTQPLGLRVAPTPTQVEALARPVTLRLKGRGRLELVEAVCREVGLYPVYPDDTAEDDKTDQTLTLKSGRRPVAFAGPFRVAVVEAKSEARELGVRVLAVGLPPAVALPLRHGRPVVVAKVAGPDGVGWLDRGRSPGETGTVSYSGFDATEYIHLQTPAGRTVANGVVEGRVRVPVATRVVSLMFMASEAGATKTAGGTEVTLVRVTDEAESINGERWPRTDFYFRFKGMDLYRLEFAGYDAGGRLRPLRWRAGGGTGPAGGTWRVGFRPPLAKVTVKVLAGVEYAEYPFRLDNVRLVGGGQ
jgi:RNA polymerase sigma factor (sigma-70 family)